MGNLTLSQKREGISFSEIRGIAIKNKTNIF
jgi:hypothetical protein